MHTRIATKDNACSIQGTAWNTVFAPIEGSVRLAITEVSAATGISERDVQKQLLLHLPQFSVSELRDLRIILSEAERLAAKVLSRRQGYEGWQERAEIESLRKPTMVLQECSPEIARQIHERFHYIGSYHEGLAHLGLYMPGCEDVPLALASLAPMDIRRLDPLFQSAEDKESVLVLSRVFAFDWAPRNTVSFLLGRLSDWIRGNLPRVRTLLTFLNPNLGFSGSSFLASNWKFFIEIEPVYSYLEGDYISYRTFIALPPPLRKSVMPCSYHLRPLRLLRYDLKGRRET